MASDSFQLVNGGTVDQTYHRAGQGGSVPFSAPQKAWDRVVELVVYDPSTVGNPGLLLGSGEALGLVVSGLHVDFKVTRSRTYSENTAEFKVYNANPVTRARLTQPGMRVRFSAGYEGQGGAAGIFWGSVTQGSKTEKKGTDWVTTINCISSLTEATGSEDIARWAANPANKGATDAEKRAKITSAINRIPVSVSYAPKTQIRRILLDFQVQTGLSVYGADALPTETLKNGFSFAGGIRDCIDQFIKQCLKPIGWLMYIDNSTIFVYPANDKLPYTVTAVYLTLDTGYLSSTDKTKANIPPKIVNYGKTARGGIQQAVKNEPRVYEVKCLLNPKIAPNTLAYVDTPGLFTTLLLDKVDFEGNNYGSGFDCTFEGHVYQGGN